MKNNQAAHCPCCHNHCPKDDLRCGKGKHYFSKGKPSIDFSYDHEHCGFRHHRHFNK